jgi:hypothetical protein
MWEKVTLPDARYVLRMLILLGKLTVEEADRL